MHSSTVFLLLLKTLLGFFNVASRCHRQCVNFSFFVGLVPFAFIIIRNSVFGRYLILLRKL